MRIRATAATIAAAIASGALFCHTLWAQAPPQAAPVQHALFAPGGAAPNALMDAHGGRVVLPASYHNGCACGQCGGGACPPGYYGGHGGAGAGWERYAGGYPPAEPCGPHYFDANVEFVALKRTEFGSVAGDTLLTTLNVLPGGTPSLSTGDLDPDYEAGFRATGRYDLGALSVIEFGYTGIFDMGDVASFTDPDPVSGTEGNLFSPFTDFGQNPVGGIGSEPEYFAETDRAVSHSVRIDSQLQSAELSYRRYWVGYSPRVSGTMLCGFRYTRLKDLMQFQTLANGTFDYAIEAENDLSGFQTGGDVWVTCCQGVRVGAEGKAGIYGNQYDVNSRLQTSPADTVSVTEHFEDEQVAFIFEGRVMAVVDVCPSWSLKAGYEVLFLNSIVTSMDNFNAESPYPEGEGAPRQAFLWDQSNAWFHGFHAGFEYIY